MPDASSTLNRLSHVLWTEMRLLIKSWGYWLLHGLWAALMIYLFLGRDNRSAHALLETSLGGMAIGMISLFGLFLAGVSASRSRRVKFHDLEDALPTGTEVSAGRWLAGVLALLFLLVEPIAIAANQGPLVSLLAGLPTFLAEAALTIAFTTAFAWLLVTWLRPGRWVYPLLAAGWLGFMLGPMALYNRFPSASLLNFMRQGTSFYSEAWGRLVYGQQPLWFNLFYVGLLLLCVSGLAVMIQRRRFRRSYHWSGLLLVTAVVLSGIGAMRYVAGVQAVQAVSSSSPTGEAITTPPSFTVDSYDLSVDLSDPDLPHFSALITVRNTSDQTLEELVFILNPSLDVSGAALPVHRNGQYFSITLDKPLSPGDHLDLTIPYTGTLRREVISWMIVEATDFIEPRGVRLTPAAGWYPVPAGEAAVPGMHDLAHIRLQITGSELKFGTNLPPVGENTFEADEVGWVFLAGSPHLITEQTGDSILVTTKTDLPQARQLMEAFTQQLGQIAPFFPETQVHGLVLMVLGEEDGLPEDTPPASNYPVIVLTRYRLNLAELLDGSALNLMVRALAGDLWRLSGGVVESQAGEVSGLEMAFNEIVTFIRTYIQEGGDAAQMQAWYQGAAAEFSLPADTSAKTLLDLYSSQGKEGILRILYQIRSQTSELSQMPTDDLPGWFQAAAEGGIP